MTGRLLGQRSYGVLILVLLLVTVTGWTLLHWHQDWNDRGCQLCHVRHLPSTLNPVAQGPISPTVTERALLPDDSVSELESCFVARLGRAPPSSSFTFTV